MKIAGIVLAGGSSSRMGQNKAQLLFDNETLLARNVALLSSLALPAVFVSGQYDGVQCIADLSPSLGPLGGLHACSEFLYKQYDAMFITPVDMPLLGKAECVYLLQQFISYPQGVFYEHATFPMIVPLTMALKDYLADVLTSPHSKQRSLYRLLKTLKLQAISYPIAQRFRFQNSNTPEELLACLATYHALKNSEEI